MVNLHLGQPPPEREPGRVRRLRASRVPRLPSSLSLSPAASAASAAAEASRSASSSLADRPAPASMASSLRLGAGVLRRLDAGPRPDQQVPQAVGVTGDMRQHVARGSTLAAATARGPAHRDRPAAVCRSLAVAAVDPRSSARAALSGGRHRHGSEYDVTRCLLSLTDRVTSDGAGLMTGVRLRRARRGGRLGAIRLAVAAKRPPVLSAPPGYHDLAGLRPRQLPCIPGELGTKWQIALSSAVRASTTSRMSRSTCRGTP